MCVFADHIVDAVNKMYSGIIHKAVTHSFICTEQTPAKGGRSIFGS